MDMIARQEFEEKVYQEMDIVSRAYETFKKVQLTQDADLETFRQAKKQLKERLKVLNELLNRNYHKATSPGMNYDKWKASYQPFHWLAEYYDIINGNGGFDVIIGNPPYVEFSQSNLVYGSLKYKTLKTLNLHALCVERSKSILNPGANMGMILPVGAFSTQNMIPLMDFLEEKSLLWLSFYHFRPARLFDGGKGASIPTTIFIRQESNCTKRYATGVNKFTQETRFLLFNNIKYIQDLSDFRSRFNFCFPKISNVLENSILKKVLTNQPIINYRTKQVTRQSISYRTAGGLYWKIVINFDFPYDSTSNKKSYLIEQVDSRVVTSFLNSSLQWLICTVSFDTLNFKDYYIFNLPFTYNTANQHTINKLVDLCDSPMNNYKQNAKHKYRGDTPCYEITANKAKPILDEIDKVLAKHYGFTEEELDFIINYDIKYRMGDELYEE